MDLNTKEQQLKAAQEQGFATQLLASGQPPEKVAGHLATFRASRPKVIAKVAAIRTRVTSALAELK